MGASKSFSTRLSLNILLIVSILFIIALGIVAVSSHLLIAEEATKNANNTLKSSISSISGTLQKIETATQNTAWVVKENIHDSAELYKITQELVKNNPEIIGSAIAFDSNYFRGKHFFSPYSYLDTNNELLSFQLGTSSNDYFTQEWYAIPSKSSKPHWSEPYFDYGGAKELMSTYSFPIKDQHNKVIAIITADISLEWLTSEVTSIHPYEHSFAVFVSSNGNYLASGKENIDENQNILQSSITQSNENLMEMAQNMLEGKDGSTIYHVKGKVGFAVYGPIYNGWSAVIFTQYSDVLHRTSQMHLVLVFVGLFGLLIMFIICYRTIRHLTQPLTEFSVSALTMAKGNFHAQLPEIKSRDEMLRLHDSFAYMQKSINTYISALRTTTANNERMESELNIARTIQLGMLSKDFPINENTNLHALIVPAKEVGGDLYDFYIKDNKLYFTVGDVSGKGVPAALVMAITRAAVHFFSSMGLSPQKIIEQLNSSVSEGNEMNMFATLFTGCIDLNTKNMQYCNAGHNPIIVIPPTLDEQPYYLHAQPNLAIGLFGDFSYNQEELTLAPGSRLIIYTDGVSEAETSQKELFGEDRLLATVSTPEFRNLSSENMVNTLYATINDFIQENEPNDDITILAITLN